MNPYFLVGAVIAVAVAGGAGYVKGSAHGKMVVQAEWDQEKAKLALEYAAAQAAAREKEQALQAQANQLREDANARIKDIDSRANKLVDSLRNRAERPATQAGAVSGAAQSCSGASGAELDRRNGEFLAWYAADAARLASALDTCLKQYEAIRNTSR
jgi:sugar (pentulose or hexulose) kinase